MVSIERLAAELYGGETPVSAVTQVHRQVSELRRLLDAEDSAESVIETRPPGYLIRVDAHGFDLHHFEGLTTQAAEALSAEPRAALATLREALALWRGPPLGDLEYEPFAQAPIARLEDMRLAALEHRIEAELALARHADVVAELRDLAAEHPLRERLRELLMLALYRSGRQVEALEVYRSTREELVQAFGVEPRPELSRLEQAILRHDPELATPSPERDERAEPARTVLLAGRDPERLGPLLAVAAALSLHPPPGELVAAPPGRGRGAPARGRGGAVRGSRQERSARRAHRAVRHGGGGRGRAASRPLERRGSRAPRGHAGARGRPTGGADGRARAKPGRRGPCVRTGA